MELLGKYQMKRQNETPGKRNTRNTKYPGN